MREAPSSLPSEHALVGAIVLSPPLIRQVTARIDDFADPFAREAFVAMLALADEGEPIDPVTIAERMRAAHPQSNAGELAERLVACAAASGAAVVESVRAYCKAIRETSDLRRLISKMGAIVDRAFSREASVELVADASADLLEIASGRQGGAVPLSMVVGEAMDALEARCDKYGRGDSTIDGVTFGCWPIDALLRGVRAGELCIVAGGSGSGKSALAMQAAMSTAAAGGTALMLSMEMPRVAIGNRALASGARLPSTDIRAGAVDLEGWKRAMAARGRLPEGVYVDDRRTSMHHVAAGVRAWRSKHPSPRVGVFVLDFLQLVQLELQRGMSEASALSEVAYAAKALAKETDSVALVLAQLNRTAAQEADEPQMHHLRGSSGIENAADQILMLHNPDGAEEGTVMLFVRKNREGPRRSVALHWNAKFYEFSEPGGEPVPAQKDFYEEGRFGT